MSEHWTVTKASFPTITSGRIDNNRNGAFADMLAMDASRFCVHGDVYSTARCLLPSIKAVSSCFPSITKAMESETIFLHD